MIDAGKQTTLLQMGFGFCDFGITMASSLFSPISLGPVALHNRIAVSPMCQYSAQDGCASDWHLVHLGQLAMSGAALVMSEATAVEDIGRISYSDLGLYSADSQVALRRVLEFCRAHGTARLGLQLAHAGRKASSQPPWLGGAPLTPNSGAWESVAPSALPFGDEWPVPRAATEADLDRIVEAFRHATVRAISLGVDVVEVHAAHGYLLHQFLSALSNRRADCFGGSLDARMRFPLRVFEAIKSACPPHVAVGVRITGSDWIEGGITPDDAVAFACELKKRGCHFVDVTSGGLVANASIPVGPGYQVPFAETIRQGAGLPVWAVGMIVTPKQAEAIVASGKADVVALARAMLDDPRWPWHAAEALGAEISRPVQYQRAAPTLWPGSNLRAPLAEVDVACCP